MPVNREERYKYFGIGVYKVRRDLHIGGSLIILVTANTSHLLCSNHSSENFIHRDYAYIVEKPKC